MSRKTDFGIGFLVGLAFCGVVAAILLTFFVL